MSRSQGWQLDRRRNIDEAEATEARSKRGPAASESTLPVAPPVAPMLARLVRELPRDGYRYEPKWDGFRCLAFRDGGELDLRSRNQRPLSRYFPEVVEALLRLRERRFVLDGELIVIGEHGFDFEALLARLHPSASRVERLRRETPASLIGFDLLAVDGADLCDEPLHERRRRLEELLAEVVPPLYLTPSSDDPAVAAAWLDRFQGSGIDGVVAKHVALRYEPGRRAMLKVKRERTADCVVAGFRRLVDRPLPSSLLLGLYDDEGDLRHVGIASSFSESRRRELLDRLRPLVVPLQGHVWERGFLLAGGSTGRLRGAAGRWDPEVMAQDWTPVAPELVCEVGYEQLDDCRFRHPGRFRRWRPDRDPSSCLLAQLELPAVDVGELLPGQ
jgi:ATP-dependent DNA ligase